MCAATRVTAEVTGLSSAIAHSQTFRFAGETLRQYKRAGSLPAPRTPLPDTKGCGFPERPVGSDTNPDEQRRTPAMRRQAKYPYLQGFLNTSEQRRHYRSVIPLEGYRGFESLLLRFENHSFAGQTQSKRKAHGFSRPGIHQLVHQRRFLARIFIERCGRRRPRPRRVRCPGNDRGIPRGNSE